MNEDGGQSGNKAVAIVGVGPQPDQVFECCWDGCDWQFEDMTDCIDHCIAEQNGHVQSSFTNASPGTFYHILFRLFLNSVYYKELIFS